MMTDFSRTRSLLFHDVPSWHDGNLTRFWLAPHINIKRRPDLVFEVSLYPCHGASVPRFPFQIVARRVRNYHIHGDIVRLMHHAGAGNILDARTQTEYKTSILMIMLFGGSVEVVCDKILIADSKDPELRKYRRAGKTKTGFFDEHS